MKTPDGSIIGSRLYFRAERLKYFSLALFFLGCSLLPLVLLLPSGVVPMVIAVSLIWLISLKTYRRSRDTFQSYVALRMKHRKNKFTNRRGGARL